MNTAFWSSKYALADRNVEHIYYRNPEPSGVRIGDEAGICFHGSLCPADAERFRPDEITDINCIY